MADKEYIERNALISEYDRVHKGPPGGARKLMVDAPAADVVEVRRGEWVYHDCVCSYDGTMSGYSCSCCSAFIEEEVYTNMFHNSFCPSCGADMRGKKDEKTL